MKLKRPLVSWDKEGRIILSDQFLPLLLFLLFLFVFIITSGGHILTPDGMVNFLLTESLVLKGSPTLDIDSPAAKEVNLSIEDTIKIKAKLMAEAEYEKIINPDVTKKEFVDEYIKKLDLHSFHPNNYLVVPTLAVPFYLTAKSVGMNPLNFVPLFFNATIIAITGVVIFFLSKEIFNSVRIPFALSLIFCFTTFIWPYSSSLLARPTAILFMLLTIYFILKSRRHGPLVFPALAGISLGLMVLTHTLLILIIPGLIAYGIYELRNKKNSLFIFGGAIIVMLVFQGALNDYRFGSAFDFGFGNEAEPAHRILESNFDGIYGFLISPDHSIFVYFPIALLFPLGFYLFFKKNKSLALLFAFIFVVTYAFIGFTDTAVRDEPGKWNSMGAIWGPHRYLIPIIPLITITIGTILEKFRDWKMKIVIFTLGILGFIVNFLGNIVFWRAAFFYGYNIEGLSNFQNYNEIFTWDPNYSTIALSLRVLQNDVVIDKNPASFWSNVGLAGCRYDFFLFCENAILEMIGLVVGIIVVGYLIMLIINPLTKTGIVKT